MMTDRDRHDHRDPLTGVATPEVMRRFIEAALDLSEAQGPSVVVFVVGIDNLEGVAARQGRAQADSLLIGVADRLRAGLRQHDLVARLGEGFCICLPEIFTTEAHLAAERLRRALELMPVESVAGPVEIRCSVGLAFGRGPGSSAEALLDRARMALGTAQEAGGSRIVVDL